MEMGDPEGIGQNSHIIAGLFLLSGERTPQHGGHSHHRQKIGGCTNHEKLFRIGNTGQCNAVVAAGRKIFKNLGVSVPGNIPWIGQGSGEVRTLQVADHNQPVRVGERQWPQQD